MKRTALFFYWLLSRPFIWAFWIVTLPITVPVLLLAGLVDWMWTAFKSWERDQ